MDNLAAQPPPSDRRRANWKPAPAWPATAAIVTIGLAPPPGERTLVLGDLCVEGRIIEEGEPPARVPSIPSANIRRVRR